MRAAAMIFFVVLTASILNLILCDQLLAEKPVEQEKTSLAERMTTLEDKVEGMDAVIFNLSSEFPPHIASLECDKTKYEEVRVQDGNFIFLAVCEDVQKYLEGHKVRIKIGNPYTISFSGASVTVWYGKTIVEAVSSQKKVTQTIPDLLEAGHWNSIDVKINPSNAEEMRYLGVEVSVNSAMLKDRSK